MMPVRIGILRWITALGATTVAITELLSQFRLLNPTAVAIGWCIALPALLVFHPLRLRVATPRIGWFPAVAIAAIACIVVGVGWTAALSPPNSADTMSYHLPRVVHWVQNGNVSFFPTSYLNLIMLQPAAEYMMLHAWLLTGGDALSNMFQFAGFIGCIVGVSYLAGQYGLDAKGQAAAAVFCATLPNAILQASGAKNDLVLACFLVCAAVFASRWCETRTSSDLVFMALATGMAFCTKATAYLFAPPLLMAIVPFKNWPRVAIACAGGILALNAPQFVRNVDLSGSPIGFDSAHGDSLFRWRVEHPGWKPAVSNILRNTSEQLGARSEKWNQRVYEIVLRIHRGIGMNPQDPDTTWRWAEFRPPRNTNHEADANNRWHLLIFVLSLAFCRGRWLKYAAGVIGAFLLFCIYLKWQPYFSRVEVPLFVLMSPVAGLGIVSLRFTAVQVMICAVLLSNARLPVTQNWTRPLTGPKSLLQQTRNDAYFNDVGQWNNRQSYLEAVAATAPLECSVVGLDTFRNHVQYPYMVLLRQHNPSVRFTEVGVNNASSKYADPSAARPCAVLCLDCAGHEDRIRPHTDGYSESQTFGNFVLFTAPRKRP